MQDQLEERRRSDPAAELRFADVELGTHIAAEVGLEVGANLANASILAALAKQDVICASAMVLAPMVQRGAGWHRRRVGLKPSSYGRAFDTERSTHLGLVPFETSLQ
ncbi:MAG: hypothetical protein IT352_03930 [Gemmatimonadales bacterium]|nr:hypothetical protein [Gemmatimonadales bacterium]